jgi:hypothetical protein
MLHDRNINVRLIFRNFFYHIIITILNIIITDLITLLSTYLLENLPQIFGGFRFIQGKEIHDIP